MSKEEEIQSYFNEILEQVNALVKIRCLEVSRTNQGVGVPNAPNRQISLEELESIEYLNSARDIKLQLEADLLCLELQLKQQQLSSVKARKLQSHSARILATTMKDHANNVEVSKVHQAHLVEMSSRQASISCQLETCEANLNQFLSDAAKTGDQIKVMEDILQHVNKSIQHLSNQMQQVGHASLASLRLATEAVRLEADRAEQRLAELRSQTRAAIAQLGEAR